jgi:hypothetical protein
VQKHYGDSARYRVRDQPSKHTLDLLSLSIPEQSLSQPAHHNVEPILASYVPRLQFPYRILPGNPFSLPRKVSTGADFGSPPVK